MAAVHEGESLSYLFEMRDNERLLELAYYDDGETWYKGQERVAFAVLNKLRLEGEAGFCDVILEVEGRQLTAHRCILAANSPFFYTMFSSGMKESNQKVYSLQSVCFTSMSLILDYFYTREIVINDENVLDLLNASSFLLVTPVKNACSEHLFKGLGSDNCFSVLQIAEQFGAYELAEKAINYINTNFSIVVNNEEFVSISQEDLVRFISSDNILVEKEEEIYQSVLKWVKHNEANRVVVLPELLKHLRKDSLPKGFFESEMEREPLLMVTKSDGDAAPKKTKKQKVTKRSKKGKNTKSVQELRPSTEIHNVVIGFGTGGNYKAFLYDLDKREMIFVTKLSDFQTVNQIAVVGQTLYVIGVVTVGIGCLQSLCFDDFKDPSSSATDKRQLLLEMRRYNQYRQAASLVSLNGLLYYIGGYVHQYFGNALDIVESYNPELDMWSNCARLNMPRCRSGCVATEQHIYIIGGGTNLIPREDPMLSSVEKYDPETNTWSYVSPLAEARSFLGCVYTGGKIYAIGGVRTGGHVMSSCEVYSPLTDEWQTIAQLPCPYFNLFGGVITVGNKITVPFSPKQPTVPDSSYESLQYNTQSDRWTKVQNLCPSDKKGTFSLCSTKLPVLVLQKIAREYWQVDWNFVDEESDQGDGENSSPE